MLSKPFHILVIDDQAIFRKALEFLIHEEGGKVTEASSAEEALRFLSNGLAIDGITTDYTMRNVNGGEFIQQLRVLPQYSQIPIAIVSTENDYTIRTEHRDIGDCVWIDKRSMFTLIPQWLEKVYRTQKAVQTTLPQHIFFDYTHELNRG